MKIALLTKYSNLAASTRYRFDQYEPYLKKEGFELIRQPLFNNSYLKQLYKTNNRNLVNIIKSYIKRFFWLISKPDVDLIWLHCDLFPYMPGIFERLVSLPKKPIIYDFDDAIFHNYDLSSKWYVRRFIGSKLHHTIGLSKMAFCGNAYLADYSKHFCNKTKIVPTIINTEIFRPINRESMNKKPLRIGWIGTPTTYKQYLSNKIPILNNLAASENLRICIMGISKNINNKYKSIEVFEWSEKEEIAFIQSLDIGIMPLSNTPWARGKCGFKLIQYMACGLPVVASPVGVNSDIVEHGVNGFLADTNEEWIKSIKTLVKDRDLRQKMGLAGLKKIEREFSLHFWAPQVTKYIKSIVINEIEKN